MDAGFEIEEEPGLVHIVKLRGELDLGAAPILREHFVSVPWRSVTRVVVDLRGLTFMDSSGLGELIWIDRKCRGASGKRLAFVPGPPIVQRVFELTGVLGSFEWVEAESD
jgi:anti-sigma B factor antagonist